VTVHPLSTTPYRPVTELHQTLVGDVVEATDKLFRFEGREVKVKVATRSVMQNFGTPYFLNDVKDHRFDCLIEYDTQMTFTVEVSAKSDIRVSCCGGWICFSV